MPTLYTTFNTCAIVKNQLYRIVTDIVDISSNLVEISIKLIKKVLGLMRYKTVLMPALIGETEVQVPTKAKQNTIFYNWEPWFMFPVLIRFEKGWYILQTVLNTNTSTGYYIPLSWDTFEILIHKFNPNKKYSIAKAVR